MKNVVFGKWVSIIILILFVSGCATSNHTRTQSSRGHLGRAKFVPTENVSGFYGSELCRASNYHCIKIKRGDTWQALFPDEKERQLVMRLNRLNMAVHSRPWIVVPNNLEEITYNDLSPLPLQIDTRGKKRLVINLRAHAFAAYNAQGQLVHWGPISAGSHHASDEVEGHATAVGNFKIFRVHGENCKSGKYPIATNGGAPMPYCMFFHRGWAIHGSTLPGRHASHGCVRLFYEDAKWLNQFFLKIRTPVNVVV